MATLFIAEKPSLGRTIAEVIGIQRKADGYIECMNNNIVTWCFGHILELAKPEAYIKSDEKKPKWRLEDLPIIPQHWKKYVKKDAKKQFEIIKKLINKADVIVNAGDPDREGQLLVDEVLEYIGVKKPVKRIWLQALDRENILKALRSIEDNKKYLPYKLSAEARSYADWLVGMNFTRYFTLKAGTLITVGRVQTPTLALVVKRDEQIENFKPHDYYVLTANLDKGFTAVFKPDDSIKGLDEEGRLIDKATAESIAKKTTQKQGKVIEFKKTKKTEYPPLPYMLSSLQKAMSQKYGMKASEVLEIAQSLYEKKLTTYPRTDCPYIAEEQHKDAKKIFNALKNLNILNSEMFNKADLKIKHKAFDNSKLGAHTAIIPTGDTSEFQSLTEKEKKVFMEIAKAYVLLFHKPHTYYSIKAVIDIEGYKFIANGKQTIEKGFRAYSGKQEDSAIPDMKKGDTVFNNETTITTKQTTPPSRFTDGTLIDAMSHIYRYIDDPEAKKVLKENDGIGTEATRAAIIEQLVKRGYLQRKGKQIISTPIARQFIHQLPDFIKDPVLTARWERGLNGILQGKVKFQEFYNAQVEFVKKELNNDIEIKVDKNTAVSNMSQKSPKRVHYEPKDPKGAKGSRKGTRRGKKCPNCGNTMVKLKTKTGKDYYWCGKCKSAYWVEKGGKVGKKWSFGK